MNAATQFHKEIAEHRAAQEDADPVLVSLCIGRALMRFRAELDGSEPEHDDPEGYLRSCLLGLMHYANSEGIDFAGELAWVQSAFAEDAGVGGCEMLCHGYDLEECREYFFDGVEIADEEIRKWMKDARNDEDRHAGDFRREFLAGHAAQWIQDRADTPPTA